jgi:hypothetical protein
MNGIEKGNSFLDRSAGWRPAGRFLDDLPNGLYLVAHIAFLGASVGLLARANDYALPYSGAFVLYVLSQVGFLTYFAKLITMKTAVLLEQSLIFVMLVWIVLKAT